MGDKVIIRNGKIVRGNAESIKPNETEARANRENMKVTGRKDILQRNQVDYYRAYPEQAKNLSPKLRRLLS